VSKALGVTPIPTLLPSNTKLALPANEPLELYCTCVLEPPGVPPPLTVAQVASPRKYVVLDGVPVTAPDRAVTLLIIVPLVGNVTAVVAVAVKV
jgi:hypothetical protein